MTSQVRQFQTPASLAETLAGPPPYSEIPRILPTAVEGKLSLTPEDSKTEASPIEKKGRPTSVYNRVPMESETKHEGGITFAGQDGLPKLPIPDLESTCKRYLESLKPIQSPREQSDTNFAIQEFLAQDGPELQEKLKSYALGKTSYIEQFCMYLNNTQRRRTGSNL